MEINTLLKALVSLDNIRDIINNLIVLAIGYWLIKHSIIAETKRMIEEAMKSNNTLTIANTAYNIKELADKILKAKKINPKDVEMLLMLLPPYLEGGGNGLAQALADKAVNKFTNETPVEEE